MKNNQLDPTLSELEDALSVRVGDSKSRRLRSFFTCLIIFLVCVLISTAVWLVVHYVKDVQNKDASGNLLSIDCSQTERFL